MPLASTGEPLNFVDALFTATSATCVTGLIVVDTGTAFSTFGQIVILILIQIGGLGIMTLSTFFIFIVVGQFSILNRDVIQETLTQKPIKNLASLLKTTFLLTIILETIGAILLTLRFVNAFPLKKAAYLGIFHSISAFCNAGFSLFYNSFENYEADYVINAILIILIILGGIGYIVLQDLRQGLRKKNGRCFFQISFHSKIVLVTTLFLIIFGAINIFILEHENVLHGYPLDIKMLTSVFQSVTTRTAGFNTLNISDLTNVSLFFIIILMFIGASPGSCGGGIKTTTFTALIAFLISRFRNQREVNIRYRRVPEEIISKVISITFFSIIVIIVATLTLMVSEIGEVSHQQSRGMFVEILFEVVSAFGTVGLSTGLTTSLTVFGKILISLVMFIGRLGPLTVALAIGAKEPLKFRYAKENFLVG